jgi:hypothetical protein
VKGRGQPFSVGFAPGGWVPAGCELLIFALGASGSVC